MVNSSKTNDPREWDKWRRSGAVGNLHDACVCKTSGIKRNLKNLRQIMPSEDDTLYEFADFLSERLNSRLVPEGFNMAAQLALYDLKTGVDGYTHQSIRSRLVGYPSMIYALLEMRIPDLAQATCPEPFAKGVKRVYDEVHEMMRE